jgi:hypothetical protein
VISGNDSGVFCAGKRKSLSVLETHVAPGWQGVAQTLAVEVDGLAVLSSGNTAYFSTTAGAMGAPSSDAVLYKWTPSAGASPVDLSHGASLGPAGMVAVPSDDEVFWVAKSGPTCLGDALKTAGSTLTVTPVVTRQTNTGRLLLAAAQGAVYYNDSSGFWRVSATQTQPKQIVPPVTVGDPLFLAVDPTATYIYWIDQASGTPTLKRATTSGSIDQGSYPVPSPQGLAATKDAVFWIDGSCNSASSAIMMDDLVSAPTTLVGGLTCPQNLTLGGKYLYYSVADSSGQRKVYRIVHP